MIKKYTDSINNKEQNIQLPTSRTPQRNFNLDLLRIIALTFVPLTHFFLHTDFYSLNVDNFEMSLSLCLRNLGLLCIPLFMLLTGYLQGNKNIAPTLRYYTKILKFIVPYILVISFDLFFMHFYKGYEISLGVIARKLTAYSGYSWYVEMYLGLFLIIPFLNILWNGLKSKKHEHILLGILITLTVLPSIINAYDFVNSNWWNADSKDYLNLLPNFWTTLYPITFYYTGAYLCKHKEGLNKKIKTLHALLMFIASFGLFSVYCITRNWGTVPSVYTWLNRNSFGQMVTAVCLLLFIVSINIKRVPTPIAKFAGKLSNLSYTAYLVTYTIDIVLYGKLNSIIPTFSERLPYLPLMVFAVTVLSYIIAFFIDLAAKFIIKLTERIIYVMSAKTTSKH